MPCSASNPPIGEKTDVNEPDPEDFLIAQAAKGDQWAFERLYRAHVGRVRWPVRTHDAQHCQCRGLHPAGIHPGMDRPAAFQATQFLRNVVASDCGQYRVDAAPLGHVTLWG